MEYSGTIALATQKLRWHPVREISLHSFAILVNDFGRNQLAVINDGGSVHGRRTASQIYKL